MNDGKLSQEEIDALLKVPADEQEDDQQEQTADEAFLTSIEKDALGKSVIFPLEALLLHCLHC